MKAEHKKQESSRHEPLLRDIFAEDFDTSGQSARDMNLLLGEFRLAYRRRKIRGVLLAAAAALGIGLLTSVYTRDDRTKQVAEGTRPIAAPKSAADLSTSLPAKSESLTDEELLNLFPPGSCFLAELNGKQVLVFIDPELDGTVHR
jgi:hypothetical protein